jgi:GUN4-like
MTTSPRDGSLSSSNNKGESGIESIEVSESRRVEIIRDFFDDKFKHLEKDKLSQSYLSIKFANSDLEKIAQKFSDGNVIDNKLSIDDLKTMFQAYCMESSNTNKGFVLPGFVLTGLIAPVITGLCSGLAVLFFQQGILESSGAIKPGDRTVVTECTRTLDRQGYVELESLCNPLKNDFLKEGDTQTYKAIGKIIRGEEKWEKGNKTYNAEDIREKVTCRQLEEIDELWKKASNNKLGFSAQKRIWDNSEKNYQTFTKEIGWTNSEGHWNDNLSYSSKDAVEGHLPVIWNQNSKEGKLSGQKNYSAFFEVFSYCQKVKQVGHK